MIVVTRHKVLVDYLLEKGMIPADTKVINHVNPKIIPEITGQDVIGILPSHYAVYCNSVTEIPLALELKDRGKEISLERLREIAMPPRRYVVRDWDQWTTIKSKIVHILFNIRTLTSPEIKNMLIDLARTLR